MQDTTITPPIKEPPQPIHPPVIPPPAPPEIPPIPPSEPPPGDSPDPEHPPMEPPSPEREPTPPPLKMANKRRLIAALTTMNRREETSCHTTR